MYRERPSSVPGAVLWRRDAGDAFVVPDGCMDLIWLEGQVVVAGPDTAAYAAPEVTGAPIVGLRLPPGRLPSLFGVGAMALVDQRAALSDVVGRTRARLHPGPTEGAVLEELVRRHSEGTRCDPRVAAVAGVLGAGKAVAYAAAQVGLSERQLLRFSRDHFGYGPKTLGRILRFQRAPRLATAGHPAAETAVAAGFADQAHLVRESRRLTGRSFGALTGKPSTSDSFNPPDHATATIEP